MCPKKMPLNFKMRMRLLLLVLGLFIMAVVASGFHEEEDLVWCKRQGKMVHVSQCPCRRNAKK